LVVLSIDPPDEPVASNLRIALTTKEGVVSNPNLAYKLVHDAYYTILTRKTDGQMANLVLVVI
jgi:hypothetical protein